MKKFLIELVKLYLFWMLFFLVGRTLFLLSQTALLGGIPFGEILKVYPNALKLDTSAACWLMAPMLLLMALQLVAKWRWIGVAKKVLMCAMLIITSLTIFGEIGIYEEWQVKINIKALMYLRRPKEIFDSVSTGVFLLLLLGTIVYITLFMLLYAKVVAKPKIEPVKLGGVKAPVSFVILGGLLFVGMRGGFGDIPIHQSQSYFSHHSILNDAAVNTPWNLMHNYLHFKGIKDKNPFVYYDNETADSIIADIHTMQGDSTLQVLNTDRPNIVILLLESWSADVVASLDTANRAGVTPGFAKLEEEGLLFTRFYSNGHRSQQAISGILSDFPPLQGNDITDNFPLYKYLPSMPKYLMTKGYGTAFYFGGDLNYGNIRAFVLWHEFQKIFEGKDFPKGTPKGKLSVPDQYLFAQSLKDQKKVKEPFFHMIFTGSSHSPYDEPKVVRQLTWNVEQLPYLNSVKYSDSCIYDYIKKARHLPWYKNTLFILVGDHSHATYRGHYINSPAYMHVPMLWLGGALKEEFKGQRVETIGTHVDLYRTLMCQMGDTATKTYRGVDLFNVSNKGFAYYETNMGMGWITPEGSLLYDAEVGKITDNTFADSTAMESELRKAKAYLQTLYDFYLQQ
ncbi:MAG: sulfatase-like hydrolase/transferase [Bacteroidales bacterium]|nr:sulfatase-like hydrolase/transferase [Bacteroidales bacterium]